MERDTLFSGHRASEHFLQRMMSLYVASHYRNTPNDLVLMSDAPAHRLFVLLGPVDEGANALPDVLAVVQVALEGAISKRSATASLAAGQLPQGDLIPWTIGQQFQDSEFPALSGARIVRIAVHPEVGRAGYGSRAVEALRRYYEGDVADLVGEAEEAGAAQRRAPPAPAAAAAVAGGGGGLLGEQLRPRAGLPPLLVNLAERPAERLHYLGTSFGLTQPLYSFWRKNRFLPLYLRQTASDVTGEHTVVMLRALRSPDVAAGPAWLDPFVADFRCRFTSLLAGAFRHFSPALSLSILDPRLRFGEDEAAAAAAAPGAAVRADGRALSPHDLKRLQAYASNLVDHHLILDLLPPLSRAYFAGALPATLSYSQAAILLCLGLQQREVADVEAALELPSSQVLALFSKAVRRLHGHLRAAKEAEVERALPRARPLALAPHPDAMDAELDGAARAIAREVADAVKASIRAEELEQYAIRGGDEELEEAAAGAGGLRAGGVVSVKSGGKDGGKKVGGGGKKGGKDDGKRRSSSGGKDKGDKKKAKR